ncbi:MAG: hypothetical protein HYT63_00960 [Candidatus Yanofskybacteria bacterium]|nr:hypothetical protein [Candidatus Yanofskybacteria bacterium]
MSTLQPSYGGIDKVTNLVYHAHKHKTEGRVMKTGVLEAMTEIELSESPLTKSESLVVVKNQTTSLALVMPCRRKVLMEKLDNFKVSSMTAREFEHYETLFKKNTILFERLCWSKMGISEQQIKRLQADEQGELALMIYEKSKMLGLLQIGLLLCFPILGWITLPYLLFCPGSMPSPDNYENNGPPNWNNLRYFWWYKEIKRISGKNFCPVKFVAAKQLKD